MKDSLLRARRAERKSCEPNGRVLLGAERLLRVLDEADQRRDRATREDLVVVATVDGQA